MSQNTIKSHLTSGEQSNHGAPSEMLRYYLSSGPGGTTDRLVQGGVMSDAAIAESVRRKKTELDALVRQVKGEEVRRR
ncbi:hypothetical protein AAE478_005358 [Parahypoxylon ruwenzoriense]